MAAAGGPSLLEALPAVASSVQTASQAAALPALLIIGPEGDFTGGVCASAVRSLLMSGVMPVQL